MAIIPGFEEGSSSQEIFDLIWRDDLTSLFNRRFFARYMKQVADWAPGAEPVCLAMMDMDNLKRVNDRLGHLSGDTCLKRIGHIMLEVVPEDIGYAVRYAGDEFALVLPGMAREAALELADTLRAAVAKDDYEGANLPDGLRPSLSIGIACFPEDAPAGGDDLTETADKALYHSKRTGKNKVTSAADLAAGDETISDLEALSGFPSNTLIGREEAFSRVDDALSLAFDGRNAFLLVEGEPGTGKTRLLSEIVKYAREREAAVLIERCNAVHREEPYKALGGLLETYLRAKRERYTAARAPLSGKEAAALAEILPVFRPRRSSGGNVRGPNGRPPPTGSQRSQRPPPTGAHSASRPEPDILVPDSEPTDGDPPPTAAYRVQASPPPREGADPATRSFRVRPDESSAGDASGERRVRPDLFDSDEFLDPEKPAEKPTEKPTEKPAESPRGGSPRPRSSGSFDRSALEAALGVRQVKPKPEPEDTPPESKDSDAPASEAGGDEAATKPDESGVRPALDESGVRRAPATPRAGLEESGVSRPARGPDESGVRRAPKSPRPLDESGVRRGRRAPGESGEGSRRSSLDESGARRRPSRAGGLDESGVRRGSRPRRRTAARRPVLSPEELSVNLFQGLRKALTALAAETPLVVILDEINAADEPTLEVIRSLLPDAGRILFVGSARTAASSLDDSSYAGFCSHLKAEVSNAFKIELGPFDAEKTLDLAELLLQGFRPPDPLASDLFRFTQGNPLYTEGVLRHLIDTQLLSRTETGWRVAEALPREIPVTLEDVLRQGLAILDPDTASLLSEAAVVGPNFEFNVLRSSSSKPRSEGETLDLVSEAVRQKVLREASTETDLELEFRSTADSEVSYAQLETEERQEAHQRVAEVLDGQEGQEAAAAYHFSRSGDREAHERVLARVRERRELLFNRKAIESILVGAGSNLPELSEEPSLKLAAQLPRVAKALASGAKVVRLYATSSKVVEDALRSLVAALKRCHEHAEGFTIGHRGNTLLLNGHSVDAAYASGEYQEALVGIYRVTSIKSLTFMKGVTPSELLSFLSECAKHTVMVPLERYFWRVFAKEANLNLLGVAQKALALKHKRDTVQVKRPRRRPASAPALTNEQLPLLKEIVRHFMVSLGILRKRAANPNAPPPSQPAAHLERALRQLFEQVPGLVLQPLQADPKTLIVNGTPFEARTLGKAGVAILRVFNEGRVRGFLALPEVTSRELERFMIRLASIPQAPSDDEATNELARDGSFPNLVVGEALFELAHALVQRGAGDETKGLAGIPEFSLDKAPPVDVLLPKPTQDPDLPETFTWPSDALYTEARRLYERKPVQLLDEDAVTFAETLEKLFLLPDAKAHEAARLVLERLALNFASQDARERKKVADSFASFATKAEREVRTRFYKAALKRLVDALELEGDSTVFEKLAGCARLGILDQIAEGDWDMASRLTRALGRRRGGRAGPSDLAHIGRKEVESILADPRSERLFETIEAGSQQERRKAARVLEAMGDTAVERLVGALTATERGRVENFLIDMLAALVPTSETALRKELTPETGAEAAIKLIRASAVVCRDAAPVFISGLSHSENRVQSATLSEARKVGGKVAQQVLQWALTHGSAQIRLEAVKHLGEMARPESMASLIQLTQTTTLVEVQRECCLAFGKMALTRGHHDKIVPVLAGILTPGFLRKDYHEDVRHAAAWALSQMTEAEAARRALKKVVDDSNERVARVARMTLDHRKSVDSRMKG
jgi:diguanylate cyclase (GGDEF)-like protein